MRLRRALWIDNFEDGTFEDYWTSYVDSGTGEISLQEGWKIKDGYYSLRADFDLTGSGDYQFVAKKWTSPQIDLTDYDRIYFWLRSSVVALPRVYIRQDGVWDGGTLASGVSIADTWELDFINLSGTRNLVDGIRFEFLGSKYGTDPEQVFIDGIVAVRTDTDHQYNFTAQNEDRLVRTITSDIAVKKLPGNNATAITDRGKQARRLVLTGDYSTLSDKDAFERVLRSGNNLYLLTGLQSCHAVVVRVAGRGVSQLAGRTSYYPFSITFVESLESSL